MWHDVQASEMRLRFACRTASQRRSRGPQSDTSPGMADRPSERRCLGIPTSDLAGKEPGTPSTHARGQGGRDAAKSFLRYPAGQGGQAGQAPGGRRRRPSRAFFAPNAGYRSWPSGASPDALLLLHPLGRPAAARQQTFPVQSSAQALLRLPTRPLKPLRAQPIAGRGRRGHASCRRREEQAGPGS